MTVCQGPIDIFFNVTLLYVPVSTMALYVYDYEWKKFFKLSFAEP